MELRENRATTNRSIVTDRANFVNTPFLENSVLASAYLKTEKTRYGEPGDIGRKYIELYKMSEEEATVWTRFQLLHLERLYGDWQFHGNDNDELNRRIRNTLGSRDQALAFALFREVGLWSPGFMEHIDSLIPNPEWEWTAECGFNNDRCASTITEK